MRHILIPRRRTLSFGSQLSNVGWASWDEVTEAGWGDSANVFIILAEASGAGDNEIGQGGGLAEVDRTWTEDGNLPGAVGTGTGKYRAFDGATHRIAFTQNLGDLIKNQTKWQILSKVSHIIDSANDSFFNWEAAVAGNAQIDLRIDNADPLELVYNENGVGQEILATANNLTFGSATPTWVSVLADGSNNVRFFHHTSTTKPDTWDDIAAGDKNTLVGAGLDGTITDSFDGTRWFFDNAATYLGARWYYSIVSSGKTLFE